MRFRTRLCYALLALLVVGGTTVAAVRRVAAARPFEGPGVIPVEAYVEEGHEGPTEPYVEVTDEPGIGRDSRSRPTPVTIKAVVGKIEPLPHEREGCKVQAWIVRPPRANSQQRWQELVEEEFELEGKLAKGVANDKGVYRTSTGVEINLYPRHIGKRLRILVSPTKGGLGVEKTYRIQKR